MSITFAYPTIAAPTASVVLGDIEGYPHTRPWRIFQSAFDTDAATQVIYDHGDPYQAIPLTLYPLTTAESNALIKFFKNTVKGRALSFEIQDTAGDIYPVNFAQDVIDPMQTNIGIWSINIVLRVVSRISQYLLYMPLESNLDLVAGSGDATFTRSTIGTYVEDDTVKIAAINTPRFEAEGFLHEGASTNNALHNRDLTDVVWIKTNGTAAKDAIGHDGVTNAASSFTATSGNATCLQTITNASEDRTFSVDLKRRTGSGTVEITIDGGSTWIDITSSLSPINWFRGAETLTVTNSQFGIRIVTSGDVVEVDYAQNETLLFASSRISTTTTAVTRTAESLSIPFAGNMVTAGEPFTLLSDGSTLGATGGFQAVLFVTGESFRGLYFASSDLTDIRGYHDTPLTISKTTIPNQVYHLGMKYDDKANLSLYRDGAFLVDGIRNIPSGTASAIRIGDRAGNNPLYGHLRNIKIYDVALHGTEIRYA